MEALTVHQGASIQRILVYHYWQVKIQFFLCAFLKLRVFLCGQFFCRFLQKLQHSDVARCQSPGYNKHWARAAGGGGNVLRCCPVSTMWSHKTESRLLLAWHSSLRWVWRDLNVCGNRGTRVLGLGEKSVQRKRGVGGALRIFLRSCYGGRMTHDETWHNVMTQVLHCYFCISKASAACHPHGDREEVGMVKSLSIVTGFSPTWTLPVKNYISLMRNQLLPEAFDSEIEKPVSCVCTCIGKRSADR